MTTPDPQARTRALLERLYLRAESLMDRLETLPFVTLIAAGRGAQETAELQFVPPGEERDIAQAIATYLRQAQEIEKLTGEGDKLAPVESMLGRLAINFGILNADGTPVTPEQPGSDDAKSTGGAS